MFICETIKHENFLARDGAIFQVLMAYMSFEA